MLCNFYFFRTKNTERNFSLRVETKVKKPLSALEFVLMNYSSGSFVYWQSNILAALNEERDGTSSHWLM